MIKNILLVTMSMDIGGAETHILELAKGLKSKGYNIYVASNGGMHVDDLIKNDIVHFEVPLHNKKPVNMIHAYKMLNEIVIKNKIDMVHSHARIPSYICKKLQKKLGFKFVTTAHFKFTTKYGLKYLTDWGDYTLAVSEDIKTYLLENYEIDSNQIDTTINAIDTNHYKLSENYITEDLEEVERLNSLKNGYNIVHIARMENHMLISIKQLIDIAPKLYRHNNNSNIIIIGDGQGMPEVRQLAEKMNRQFQRKIIHVLGAKKNIPDYLNIADVFVGISRSALEAMACYRPVILAGYMGYRGIFTNDLYDECKLDNFTCRNSHVKCDQEQMYQDIIKLIEMSDTDKQEMIERNYKIIVDDYSVERMIQDNIALYERAYFSKNESQRILLFGYIGFGNSGDDAILESINQEVSAIDDSIKVRALSKQPKDTTEIYRIKATQSFNMFSVLKAIHKADIVMGCGGSLLQDETSTNSLIYYLTLIKTAQLMGKKTALYANGIGPIRKSYNNKMAAKVIKNMDFLTLREPQSLKTLEKYNVKKPEIYVTADPVLLMEPSSKDEVIEILKNENIPINSKKVGIAFRPWHYSEEYIKKISHVCDILIEKKSVDIVFIPMHKQKDSKVSQMIMDQMTHKAYLLKGDYEAKQVMGITGALSSLIGMRLHALIYAGVQKVPMVGFSYSPKVKYYLDLFEMPEVDVVDDFDVQSVIEEIINQLENPQTYVATLEKNKSILQNEAKKNVYYLQKFLNSQLE